jgi:glycosyltransferase involved in cell wall biosynthesis
MIEKPKISFLCSIRNGSQHIKRCIKSVLSQSYNDIELILVDDHSDDSTWSFIEEIAKQDERVRAIKNYGREGLTYALNMGLDFARGEYIARIDVDDFAHADRAQKQLQAIEWTNGAVMATSGFRVVDEEDYEMYCHCPSSNHFVIKWSLCFRNNMRHSTIMWKKSLDLRYDPSFKYCQDYDMWCRISDMGSIVVVPETIVTILDRKDSITSTKHEVQEKYADIVSSKRFSKYVDAKINEKESRCLRMLYHLKNADQLQYFESMDEQDLRTAINNYMRLVDGFSKKEPIDDESMAWEVHHDFRNMFLNQIQGSKARNIVYEELKNYIESKPILSAIEKSSAD